jgi:hypothetical protein
MAPSCQMVNSTVLPHRQMAPPPAGPGRPMIENTLRDLAMKD